MPIDFSIEYSQRSDDELLHLASERHSLTMEAAVALDAELHRRNLTESDRVEYQKFVKRQERHEWSRRRRWKIPTPGLKKRMTGRDILEAFATIAFISFTYIALPSRYHFIKPDWQDAVFIAMTTSVMVVFSAISWRKIAFWMSIGISSAIQLGVVHALTRRTPDLSHNEGKGVAVLGIMLFVIVYGVVRFLQRMAHGKQTPDHA